MYKFSSNEIKQIEIKGLQVNEVQRQLDLFQKGEAFTSLLRPATLEDGIVAFNDQQASDLIEFYKSAKNSMTISRFVPSSGMATRMFKFLYYFLDNFDSQKETLNQYLDQEKTYKLGVFLSGIKKLPFYEKIFNQIDSSKNVNLEFRYRFIQKTLESYGKIPKGLIPFHRYENETRTAVQEQLKFGLHFAVSNQKAHHHFTISSVMEKEFEQNTADLIKKIKKEKKIDIQIDFSFQHSSTDTIATSLNGEPFKDNQGQMIFRAGGHGSLLNNLNSIDADIVFINNIDNITTSKDHPKAAYYKQMLAGYLLKVQEQIFRYVQDIENNKEIDIDKMLAFCNETLHIDVPKSLTGSALLHFLMNKFKRPIRVCGMVKNENEPGGGPFWVNNKGEQILQIVEGAQVDTSDNKQKTIFKSSTHFNPVDIVCGLKDHKGKSFDLHQYCDPDSYFITEKTHLGRPLMALEHPGLWNGAMAYWNTIFVEVPIATFNPVKIINDLLRPAHQS